ncbi:hypothetical protein CU313_03520, partial [Prochlorococcus marinus str. MU1404]
EWDLLDGYTDPENHYLYIDSVETSSNNVLIEEINHGEWRISPSNANLTGDVELAYTVTDEFGGSIDGTTTVTFKAPSLTTVDSQGNITLLIDDDEFGFARDAQGNTNAITYYGEHVYQNMWGAYQLVAAENINGINSVLWTYDYGDGPGFWLSQHDNNWSTVSSYMPDSIEQLYQLETNFNLDLDNDAFIGERANQAPVLSGNLKTFTDVEVGDYITVYGYDLLQGFVDPEGDTLSIGDVWTNYGYLTFDYSTNKAYLPISHSENISLDMAINSNGYTNSLNSLSFTVPETLSNSSFNFNYTVTDGENYTSTSQTINVKGKEVNYSTVESEGNITLLKDQDDLAYARDSQGNTKYIKWFGDHVGSSTWAGYSVLGAEIINGVNSVIWEYDDGVNETTFWLSQHDSNWDYINDGNTGLSGNLFTGLTPDNTFISLETNFNLDLNNDGMIGIDYDSGIYVTGSNPVSIDDLVSSDWSMTFVEGYIPYRDYIRPDITYYIHDSYGDKGFLSGYLNLTNSHEEVEELFIENTFKQMDDNISLDFTRVYNENDALIRIYKIDTNDFIQDDESLLGLSTINQDAYYIEDAFVEIIWQDQSGWDWWYEDEFGGTGLNKINIYNEYGNLASGNINERSADIIVHEIGHALGLDHPGHDPYGTWHTTVDTAMSYNFEQRNPTFYGSTISSDYAPQFSQTDLEALKYMWGSEETIINEDGSFRYSLLQDISDNGFVDNYYLANNSFKTIDQGRDEFSIHDHDFSRDEITRLPMNNIALPRELEEQDSLLSSQRINDPLQSLEEFASINPFDQNEISFEEIIRSNIASTDNFDNLGIQDEIFDSFEVKKEIITKEENSNDFI